MSDGVPTRQGRGARQTKVSFENPGKETQEFCHCERRRSNPYACRLLRRKIAPRNDRLSED